MESFKIYSESNSENAFYSELERLPKEMADYWRDRYEDPELEISDVLNDFSAFLEDRKNAFKPKIEILEGVSEEIMREIHKFMELVDGSFENEGYFLGQGRTAKVYSMSEFEGICVKFIYNESPIDISIDEEADILNTVRNFSVNGIRTPKTYFRRIDYGERHYYGMEKVDGRDLSQIIADPETNRDLITLAQNTDREAAIDNLSKYITTLYDKFGITHGDLRQSNIMLDKDGNFFIIDFGKGKTKQVGEDHDYILERDLVLLKSEIKSFFTSIDKLTIK